MNDQMITGAVFSSPIEPSADEPERHDQVGLTLPSSNAKNEKARLVFRTTNDRSHRQSSDHNSMQHGLEPS